MLKRCILAENRKLHASPIWAMFFVLPILSATYGTFNYLQNLEILTDGWYSLWTQHTLFYSPPRPVPCATQGQTAQRPAQG